MAVNESDERIKKIEQFLDLFAKRVHEDVNSTNSSFSEIEKLKKESKDLISELSVEVDKFDKIKFMSKLQIYSSSEKRLLYSEFTTYLFNVGVDDIDSLFTTIISNLENVLEEELHNDQGFNKKSTKILLKLWDHINLAYNQLDKLKFSDKQFNERIEPFVSELNNAEEELSKKINGAKEELSNTKKEIYAQLIGIVGIFVAISFVMFGGMSLLNNLFDYSGMSSVPLIEILCGGALIGLVMVNVVYAFIIFVLRITNRVQDEKDLLSKKFVRKLCHGLFLILVITGLLWFFNFRDSNDIKYVNSNCKTIEYNEETKEVTLVCPASDEESKEE